LSNPGRSPEECQEFARVWEDVSRRGGYSQDVADRLKMGIRRVQAVRRQVEFVLGVMLPSLGGRAGDTLPRFDHYVIEKKKTRCLIGSDWHIWPNEIAFAEKVFLRTLEKYKFDYVILNGDVMDQPAVSRHAPLPGESTLGIVEELEEAQRRVKEVEDRCGRAKKLYTWGNHDERFDKNLINKAPELVGWPGMSLEDHFPKWTFCLSVDICAKVVIKHFWQTSLHGAYLNTRYSGKTMITGHTHRGLIRPYHDYSGVRYGIETGTLADPFGPQFRYVNNNPRDWHPGFLILETEAFEDGSFDVRPQFIDCSLKKPLVYGEAWNK